MAPEPPVCDPQMGGFRFFRIPPRLEGTARPSFGPIKLSFGNRVLTMISVWLGA
jgi:hypothetical protein